MFRNIQTPKKLNKDDGFVMITVLMIIIVLMVLTMTIMSVNIGQLNSTEGEYRRIQAGELAKGAVVYHAAKQNSASPYIAPYDPYGGSSTLDNRVFTVSVTETADGAGGCTGIHQTNCLDIQTNY